MKKVLTSIALVFVMVMSLVACASGGDTPKSTDEPVKSSSTLGDYEVAITNAFLSKDYEGRTALVLVYDWTNNSEDTAMALTAVTGKAFQDGVQLEDAYLVDNCDYGKGQKEVRPGTTIEVECAFLLTSDTTPVEIEITEWISWDSDDVICATFDPVSGVLV